MLQLNGLTHVYRNGLRALDGIDLSVGTGLVGLLGPNGAGKSTLMRIIATLQAPSGGSVRFDGIDALAEPDRLRRVLGYLPQDFGVYPGVSPRELLDHLAVLKGLVVRAERREAVDALLHQVNLWPARDRTLARLSGGMRRRFGVAQALLGSPRLVVMDEPTAGLDPEERGRLLDLVADVAERAVVILSTHLVGDITDLCPRVVMLAAGRVRLDGSPDELVAALRGKVWRRAIGRADLPEATARLRVLSSRRVAGSALVRVLSKRQPDGFEPAEPGLEDAYFATLRRVAGHG